MKDFHQRLLRKSHRKTLPSRLIFLDTEANRLLLEDREIHSMKIAWTCYYQRGPNRKADSESWRFWEKQYPLWKYIEDLTREKTGLYVVGHNIFYDLQVSGFFRYFTRSGWVLNFIYDKGLTYILVVKKRKRTLRLISTTNYFDISLKKLGDMVGLPKLDVDFDDVSDDQLKTYCHRDVEIIKVAMVQYLDFIESNDLGKFSLTKSSQSFAAYRHRFMDVKINLHSYPVVIDLESKAYIGARCECFRLGIQDGGPFVSLDINSEYPFVMKAQRYPCRLVNFRIDPPLDLVNEILLKFACVAEVHLDTDTPIYAVRQNNMVVFPVGCFKTFLCTGGLLEAARRGHLKRVYALAIYEKADLFSRYVDFFYNLRMKSKKAKNPAYVKMLKFFLNSLYGKWAQWQPETVETEDITFEGYYRMETLDLLTGRTEMEYKLLNKVVRQIGRDPGRNSFIAISAHITEYGRLLLWRIIEEIGPENVLYCDTDSIKIKERDLKKVRYGQHPTRLGALKVDERFEYFDIRGAKNYVTDKGRHIKGIPLKAKEVEPFRYSYPSFLSQTAHLEMKVDMGVVVKYVERFSPRKYLKGEVAPDGTISPFRLSEPETPYEPPPPLSASE